MGQAEVTVEYQRQLKIVPVAVVPGKKPALQGPDRIVNPDIDLNGLHTVHLNLSADKLKKRFSKFTPTTGHRVCGAHFEGGKKTYMNRVPTIFPLRPQKVERRRPLIRTQPELPNSPTVAPQHDPEVSGSAITSSSSDSEDTAQQSTLLMDHACSSQESSYDQLAKKVACQNNIITELAEKAEAAYAHVEELNRQLKRSQQDGTQQAMNGWLNRVPPKRRSSRHL
ncbi:hypothetical protein MRX96_029845 [Rhipicephalus microplus]